MYFNVSQLMMEPSGSSRTFDVDEDLPSRGGDDTQHYTGSVRLLKTDRGIWVSLELQSGVLCTCSRCLEDYIQPVRIVIEEEFFPSFDLNTGQSLARLSDAEENFSIDLNDNLDLTEALRQYSTLSIPLKLTCEEDCKGICADCGSNRNEVECRCDGEIRDSRWGALLEMVEAKSLTNRGER